VDVQATGSGDGSSDYPFQTVIEGVLDVPTQGVVLLHPGTYAEALIIRRSMELRSRGGVVVIGAGATAKFLDCAPGVLPYADEDGDGIIDSCEQALAEKYAPVIYHSMDESNWPTNVDWFLFRTELRFRDDACNFGGDLNESIIPGPMTQAQLLGHWCYAGGCGASDTVYSNGTRSVEKERTFFLRDVAEQDRIGSLDSRDWTTYYHAYPNARGGVTVQYWRFYAYNDAALDHGGDWEGIHVVLDQHLQPYQVGFLGHSDITYLPKSDVEWHGTHPRIYSEGGGHASHPNAGGTGFPLPIFPIQSRDCSGNSTILNPDDPCTFVRQETWTDGFVSSHWCTYGLLSRCGDIVTPSGRLLNLGAKIAPMNGQVFLQYSGIWGSPGFLFESSGYWGPAFNETGMRGDFFITAWCGGDKNGVVNNGIVNVNTQRECYPTWKSR
jgi:hypothetical protein